MALALAACILFPKLAPSAEVTLEWDAVNDPRVASYSVYIGKEAGVYDEARQSPSTRLTVDGLDEGATYHFAVKACNLDETLCSEFSEEIATTITYATPSAAFTIAGATGVAPLDVAFTDASTGVIEAYAWDFGDGGSSSQRSPSHTYASPGTYTISLDVTGPGGTSRATRPAAIVVSHAPPIADFTASSSTGPAPLIVTFKDSSAGAVDTYGWDFGDGNTSTGQTAVHAYRDAGVYTVDLTVTGPGGSSNETKPDLVSVLPSPPTADFTAGTTFGPAPFAVHFSDASTGDITTYHWNFGDGATSAARDPVHTYNDPGTFDVELTVTGPGGNDTLTRPDYVEILPSELRIEAGQLTLNHRPQRVDFTRTFQDPIIILGPASTNGGQPVTARIESLDDDGFWVWLQEWDYLDGWHANETVGYVVLERGVHQLPGGTLLEAGRTEVDNDSTAELVLFEAEFSTPPVVLSSVTTVNDPAPITTRLRGIDVAGFEAQLQREEANKGAHPSETVTYLAWEPGCGKIDGMPYAVGATADDRTHTPSAIDFSTTCADGQSQFAELPVLLADMQTRDGGDTANLRWNHKTRDSVSIWVDEEQSRDSETRHTTEAVGYLAIGHTDTADP
ncbi:PKD domain-containing protein [uncultured Thiohalocapsa sp.]|uniref:PKD domain-containing protein n=1 Tax=uncultured Thiohalocapsa sp. TaxID=768990 RepID=UPI0025D11260|nr:PKD domain-containing protein [uncultured Thiohalocapsa sp.]